MSAPDITDDSGLPVVERPLSAWQRLSGVTALRRGLILVLLAVVWELYARWLDSPLMIPTFTDTLDAFRDAVVSGRLPSMAGTSLRVLLMGYALGVLLAAVLAGLAAASRGGIPYTPTATASATVSPKSAA